MPKFRLVSDHAEDLTGGLVADPGQVVTVSADDQKDANVRRLIDEGKLLEVPAQKKDDGDKGGNS